MSLSQHYSANAFMEDHGDGWGVELRSHFRQDHAAPRLCRVSQGGVHSGARIFRELAIAARGASLDTATA
jgi:hypothetical protein